LINVKEPEPKGSKILKILQKSRSRISLDSKSSKTQNQRFKKNRPTLMNVFGGHLTSRNIPTIEEGGYYAYSLRV